MPHHKHKMPSRSQSDSEGVSFRRAAVVSGGTADDTHRSLSVTLATQDPVPVWDKKRGMIVREVLVMSGAELPQQVPMVYSHDHETVRSILGSVR